MGHLQTYMNQSRGVPLILAGVGDTSGAQNWHIHTLPTSYDHNSVKTCRILIKFSPEGSTQAMLSNEVSHKGL